MNIEDLKAWKHFGPHDDLEKAPRNRTKVYFMVDAFREALSLLVDEDGTFKIMVSSTVPSGPETMAYLDAYARGRQFIQDMNLTPAS